MKVSTISTKLFLIAIIATCATPIYAEVATTDTKAPQKQSATKDRDAIGALIRSGNWKQAEIALGQILSKDPSTLFALLTEDVAHMMTKTRRFPQRCSYPHSIAWNDVQQWVESLTSANPDNPNILILNAIFYDRVKNDSERSVKLFQKVLDTHPDNVLALVAVAASNGTKGRFDEAVALSEKAISKDPDCAHAYETRGMVAWKKKQMDEAENYFKKAIACTDADAASWGALGMCYASQGRSQEAKTALLKAVECSPDSAEDHWNLGCVYYQMKMIKECTIEWRLVAKLAPDSPNGQKAIKNLKLLE